MVDISILNCCKQLQQLWFINQFITGGHHLAANPVYERYHSWCLQSESLSWWEYDETGRTMIYFMYVYIVRRLHGPKRYYWYIYIHVYVFSRASGFLYMMADHDGRWPFPQRSSITVQHDMTGPTWHLLMGETIALRETLKMNKTFEAR